MKIRQAKPADNDAIISLLWIIFEDMELPILKQVKPEKMRKWLNTAMLQPGYRYHNERILVAEVEGKIAGIAVSYPDIDEFNIDKAFSAVTRNAGKEFSLFTEPEAFPNEWYLESLVVSPDFRGQGIATKLINSLKEKVKQQNYENLGLNVDIINPKAKALYTRLGFKKVGMCELAGHQYEHLQCKV